MIASLTGIVRGCGSDWAVIDVNGVGYRVNITTDLALVTAIGDHTTVVTSLVVREDSLTLFGFSGHEELQLFESLVSVTGVGPRSAMAILSTLSPGEIFSAVTAEDDRPFTKVSGIGPKTAKLIVVQLAGKLQAVLSTASSADSRPSSSRRDDDVVSALVGLGWPLKVASQTVEELGLADDVSVSDALRTALAALGRGTRA